MNGIYQNYPDSSHIQDYNNNGHPQSSDFNNNCIMMANGRFMITKSIGKGSFGEIFQGLDTQTNKEVAIKMVSFLLVLQLQLSQSLMYLISIH